MLSGLMDKHHKCESPSDGDVGFVLSLEPSFEGCGQDYDWVYLITSKNLIKRHGRTEAEIRARHLVSRLGERILQAWKSPPKFLG